MNEQQNYLYLSFLAHVLNFLDEPKVTIRGIKFI